MTKREATIAAIGLTLVGVVLFLWFRVRHENAALHSQVEFSRQVSYNAPISTASHASVVVARYRQNQVIVGFRPDASEGDKQRVNQRLGAIASETIRKASWGSHLALDGAIGSGDIQLVTVRAEPAPPITGRKNRLEVFQGTGATNSVRAAAANEIRIASLVDEVKADHSVQFAQPNYLYKLSTDPPDDEFYASGRMWNMYGTNTKLNGQPIGNQFGSHVDAAWANGHTGSADVYVALIDSGIDTSHPDLAQNIDTHDAADFTRDSSNPTDAPYVNKDEIGHGTHVAGVIGAIGNNKIGVVGINWRVKLIPMKVVSASGDEEIDDATAIKAFDRITDLKSSGVNIVAVNLSWGGYGIQDKTGKYVEDYALLRSLKKAAAAGILCVASAGNDQNDNDSTPEYPSSFDTRDTKDGTVALTYNAVVSVAAIDNTGRKWIYSNYGSKSVSLGAPGVAILSTLPAVSEMTANGSITSSDGSTYGVETGTSAAAPHVTGAIALYIGSHPGTNPQAILNAIFNNLNSTPSLAGNTVTGGRLDLEKF